MNLNFTESISDTLVSALITLSAFPSLACRLVKQPVSNLKDGNSLNSITTANGSNGAREIFLARRNMVTG